MFRGRSVKVVLKARESREAGEAAERRSNDQTGIRRGVHCDDDGYHVF